MNAWHDLRETVKNSVDHGWLLRPLVAQASLLKSEPLAEAPPSVAYNKILTELLFDVSGYDFEELAQEISDGVHLFCFSFPRNVQHEILVAQMI